MLTHETDFYTWTQEQVALLRDRNFTALDIDNLIDEIEGMAKSERRELESRLIVLLAHLLKWQYQQDHRSNSWRLTIEEQRFQSNKCLRQNPGLKPSLPAILEDAFEGSRFLAAKDTGFKKSVFPDTCPWSQLQVLDDNFMPE